MFELVPNPHKQNDCIWVVVSQTASDCRKTAGSKCMTRTGMIDNKCLPFSWLEDTVGGKVNFDLLQNTLLPSVKGSATQNQSLHQYDGAPCHVTRPCLDFLPSKFVNLILSHNLEQKWQANCPVLTPIHFPCWIPESMKDQNHAVEDLTAKLDDEAFWNKCRYTRMRVHACVFGDPSCNFQTQSFHL